MAIPVMATNYNVLENIFLGLFLFSLMFIRVFVAGSINLARFTFLGPGSLFLRNKSYWIHEGPSKSVQVLLFLCHLGTIRNSTFHDNVHVLRNLHCKGYCV